MSATGRGGERRPDDQYYSPSWVVDRLLDDVDLPVGRWLEPCAGEGAIIRAVNARRAGIHWTAVELREECRTPLERLLEPSGSYEIQIRDFFSRNLSTVGPWDVLITNPPFSLAQEFIERSLPWVTRRAVFLLRTNFLESEARSGFLRENPPDVYILPNRPSFTEDGKTDATSYGWFVWPGAQSRRSGEIRVLRSTPLDVRRPKKE